MSIEKYSYPTVLSIMQLLIPALDSIFFQPLKPLL